MEVATAKYSKKINKAFVLSPEDIRYFYGEAKQFMDNNASGAIRTKVIGEVKNLEALIIKDVPDAVIEYSNPRSNEIAALAILADSEGKEYSFKLLFRNTPFEPPAELTVTGKSLPTIEPCFRKVEAELRERSQWYSFLSNRVWLAKCRFVLIVIGALLLISSLTSIFRRAYMLKKTRAEIKSFLNEYDAVTKDPNQVELQKRSVETLAALDKASSSVQILKWVLVGVCAFFLGKYTETFIHYLFPRVVFEVGAGKKRHETVKKVRKWLGYWLMTLLVGTVLILIGRTL